MLRRSIFISKKKNTLNVRRVLCIKIDDSVCIYECDGWLVILNKGKYHSAASHIICVKRKKIVFHKIWQFSFSFSLVCLVLLTVGFFNVFFFYFTWKPSKWLKVTISFLFEIIHIMPLLETTAIHTVQSSIPMDGSVDAKLYHSMKSFKSVQLLWIQQFSPAIKLESWSSFIVSSAEREKRRIFKKENCDFISSSSSSFFANRTRNTHWKDQKTHERFFIFPKN